MSAHLIALISMPNAFDRELLHVRQQLAALLPERAQLEAKIAWLQSEAARLEHLTTSASDSERDSLADIITAVIERGGVTAGFTDSCRRVLQAAGRPLRANEVVTVLHHSGFSIHRYVDPLSTTTTVLYRLSGRGEVHVSKSNEGWPLFAWIRTENKPSDRAGRARKSARR